MILIFSISQDYSTNMVLEWLDFYDQKYIRVNDDEIFQIEHITFDSSKADYVIVSQKNRIQLKDIQAMWYRRGSLNLTAIVPETSFIYSNAQIDLALKEELKDLRDFLFYLTETKTKINSFFNRNPNKLIVLEKAKALGLRIPQTFIQSSNKAVLSDANIITKAISDFPVIDIGEDSLWIYTERVDSSSYQSKNTFFPSLFQYEIDKLFEIRTFILNKRVYSMAIFSQQDKATEVDFRKYNNAYENRTVPFKLPVEIEKKILTLLDELNLNSGSIDMIYSKSGEYVFLEVNPVGQFGMVSRPCNYYLEREVARTLSA